MKKILFALFGFIINNIINLFVGFFNLFVWRKKSIWIIGAWFGDKFSDNSRYLYQFLWENKRHFGIERVIWMTRNKQVYDELAKMDYDVMMINSFKGVYYHLKSGVHVLCNNASFSMEPFDLNTYLSFGAKKIQLWHGVGIKACGKLKNSNSNTFVMRFYYSFICRYGQPGMWGRCYHLATSEENHRVAIEDFGVIPRKVIDAYYPRNTDYSVRLLTHEIKVISLIKQLRTDKKIILYLPTFKSKTSGFVFPHEIDGFEAFLQNNNLFWLQKNHSADTNKMQFIENKNILTLDSNFDVNVIIEYIDLLISDYSSATTDAISKDKMTLEYCPDFENYKNHDRGFVNDYERYHIGNIVYDQGLLFSKILECLSIDVKSLEKHKEVKEFLLGPRTWSMDEIVQKIMEVARIRLNPTK